LMMIVEVAVLPVLAICTTFDNQQLFMVSDTTMKRWMVGLHPSR
jgi:hypothetical protein